MTELTFLVELLLNHKLPKPTKDLVARRIKEVEEGFAPRPAGQIYSGTTPPPGRQAQAPSTMAALARHPDLMEVALRAAPGPTEIPSAPVPIEAIAQTAATQAALASRQETINLALSGKPEKGRTSPRKF